MSKEKKTITTRKKTNNPDVIFFQSGRVSFNYLLSSLKPKKIFVPNLICPDLLQQIVTKNIKLDFYNVDLKLNATELPNLGNREFILIINYFGKINKLINALPIDKTLVDNSHLMEPLENFREYHTFGSLRKIFPLNDGGFSKRYSTIRYAAESNLLAYANSISDNYIDIRANEKFISNSYIDMSSSSMFNFMNFDSVKYKENILNNFLNFSKIVPSAIKFNLDIETPAYFILKFNSIKDRDYSIDLLRRYNVFAAIHWQIKKEFQIQLKLGQISEFARLTLSLPLHYDKNSIESKSIIKALKKLAYKRT